MNKHLIALASPWELLKAAAVFVPEGSELRIKIDREILLQHEQPIMSLHNLEGRNINAATVERKSNG